jgi:DnaK suppressor protein
MTYKDFEHFRQILVDKRANVLNRSLGIEAGWRALKEPDPELEEEAQKMSLTGLYDQLEFRDKREIDEIDHALLKIGEGTFGHCERCRRPISRARLEALPEARFCLGCARRFESRTSRPNPGSEAISCSEAPSGYEDLSDEDLVELVREALRNDGSVDMQEEDILFDVPDRPPAERFQEEYGSLRGH